MLSLARALDFKNFVSPLLCLLCLCPQKCRTKRYITFYAQKHIAPLTMCYNPPLVHNKPLGAPAFVKLSVVIRFNSNSNSGVGVETCAVGAGVDNQVYVLVLGVGIQTHGVAVENPRVGVGIGLRSWS